MKRVTTVFLLTSIFVIKLNNLVAQEGLEPAPVDFTQEDISLDSAELRKIKIKISASKILQGLATTCLCIAKIAGASNKKERKEATYTALSSAIQIAADACAKHKKQPKENQDQEIQVHANAETIEQSNSETNAPASTSTETKSEQNTATKSVNFGYIQQIQDFNTEQEKMEFINEILQNKQTTEALLDELNLVTKVILIDALFDN